MDEFYPTTRRWVEVISGGMFSGKSEELIRRVRRALIGKRQVQVFKSMLDDRYEGLYSVCTHDQVCITAQPVQRSADILEKVEAETEVVAIDEVQFLDEYVVEVINQLADSGRRVIVAGADMDFKGEPFGPMGNILAIAERVDKLNAVCSICGGPATRNQRLVDGKPAPASGPTIQVGHSDSYEARCRECHLVE